MLFAVLLARRMELLGGARGARRERLMDRSAKAYLRIRRIQQNIPYAEPGAEIEPAWGGWRRRGFRWLRRREKAIFELIVEESRRGRFQQKLGEKLDEQLQENRIDERVVGAALKGVVAEELLRRYGELLTKRERRWWRRFRPRTS